MAGVDGPFATVACDSPQAWAESSRGSHTPETFERHGYVVVGETEIHLGPRACYVLDLLFAQTTPDAVLRADRGAAATSRSARRAAPRPPWP